MKYHDIKTFPKDQLRDLIEKGVAAKAIRKFSNDDGTLFGYDYSEICTFDKMWDDHPIAGVCRGLILDKDYNVVGLPFAKFFNFSEPSCKVKLPDVVKLDKITALEKVDGSMGVCFFHNNQWNCNTRGSFSSDQAKMGKTFLDCMDLSSLNTSYTYICEIIYPENRVVVDYGDFRGLILLGAFNRDTFEDISEHVRKTCKAFTRVCQEYSYSFEELNDLMSKISGNEEGFVCVLDNDMFKMKGDEYCRIHKLKDNLNPKFIWEVMSTLKQHSLNDIIKIPDSIAMNIPEEFIAEMNKIWSNLIFDYNQHVVECETYYKEYLAPKLPELNSQKDIALHILGNEYLKEFSSVYFTLMKSKYNSVFELADNDFKTYEYFCKLIKPKGE